MRLSPLPHIQDEKINAFVLSCTIELVDMLLLRKCICKQNSIFNICYKMATDSSVVIFQVRDDEIATHAMK